MANEVNDGSDQVERVNRGDRTSENTSKDSIIGGDRQDHQKIHEKASKAGHTFDTFSDNDDDQSFKAIQPAVDSFGIDFGGYVETSKGLVPKPSVQDKGQEILEATQALKPSSPDSIPLGGQNYRPDQLIAANMTPNNSVVSDAANYSEPDTVPDKETDTKISQGLPTDVHTPFESGEVLRPAIEAAGEVGKVVIESGIEAGKQAFENATHPFREKIESTMKQIPEANWSSAYDAFPQFKGTGLSKQQSIEVMKAIVRNELYNYDKLDEEADEAVKKGDSPLLAKAKIKPENKLTLGVTQISTQGIFERQAEFPKQFNFKGHEQKALLEPENAPLIIAATLAHNIEMYQRHKIAITEESLAYSYNPPDGKVLPESLNGDHVRNVMRQLKIIRGEIVPNPNER